MDFIKKIAGIGGGVRQRRSIFAKGLAAAQENIQLVQLLLDKAGELLYVHKIFQHLSCRCCRDKDECAKNLPAGKRCGQRVLPQ